MNSNARPFESIQPVEYVRHPVWEMALGSSDMVAGWNETWRKPVIGSTDLKVKSVGYFLGLRVENTPLIANALFYCGSIYSPPGGEAFEGDWIGEIFIWSDEGWHPPRRIPDGVLSFPVVLEAIPSIRNLKQAKFLLASQRDEHANRIA